VTDEYDELDLLTGGIKYPAPRFREDDFIRMYRPLVSRYLDMRVLGMERESAFLQCFGTDYYDQHLIRRIEALEGNEAFQNELGKRLDAKTPEQMFDLKKAIWNWMSIINSNSARDSSKVAAIKELQVLYGLTVIDANGNTRAGKTLADFYKETDQQKPLTAGAGELHAEPGSPEAQAFEANTS
jgi:hypothetical protein